VLTERRSRYSGSIKEERFCINLDEFTQGEAPIPRFLLVIEPGVVPSFLRGIYHFPGFPLVSINGLFNWFSMVDLPDYAQGQSRGT
jgi:hypothetical protein